MALTLAEGAKLSNDVLLQGVIETVIKDSPVLQLLPFIDISGNAITYNRENVAATAAWMAVGDVWAENTPTFTQVTTELKIVGGDADVDNYLRLTRSNVNDIEAEVIALKARAVRHEFEDKFITGTGAANQIAGLRTAIVGGQTVTAGANGAALTLLMLDDLIDRVKPGRPDLLLMSKRTRRQLNQLVRASGAFLETRQNAFGTFQEFYAGIPIGVSDFQPDNEVQGASGAVCSSAWAVQFGEGRIAGLQGGGGFQVEPIGSLETKDARRWRIKWYAGLAVFSDFSLARLQGLLP